MKFSFVVVDNKFTFREKYGSDNNDVILLIKLYSRFDVQKPLIAYENCLNMSSLYVPFFFLLCSFGSSSFNNLVDAQLQ